jgi:acyl carrier protein
MGIVHTQETIAEWLVCYVANLLDAAPGSIDPSVQFVEYGISSIAAAGLSADLGSWLGLKLDEAIAFDYPTIDRLAAHLSASPGDG